MPRPIVPLSVVLALGAISLALLAISSPATATARRAPRIACPQQASQTVPCCPLPVNGVRSSPDAQPPCCQNTPCCQPTTCCQPSTCCPSGACCPSGVCCTSPCGSGSLSIAASPDPSTAGRKVVISGVLAASPSAGAQVVLWRKLARQSSFQRVAQTTTDGAGRYTFTLRGATVMADQEWYVTSGRLRSAMFNQQIRAIVGLAPSARMFSVGQVIVLRGRVTPSHVGEGVLIEQRRGGAWRVLGRSRLGAGSSYALPHRFAHPGTIELRAVLPADARNMRSSSPTVTVAVKS